MRKFGGLPFIHAAIPATSVWWSQSSLFREPKVHITVTITHQLLPVHHSGQVGVSCMNLCVVCSDEGCSKTANMLTLL